MSLLWRNRAQRLGLCSDRLFLSKNRFIAVQPSADAAEWRAAVDALPEVLKEFKQHEVSLVIADQFVRYVLLPWNEALRTGEQWMALARHRLSAIHGAAAAGWEVKLTETAPLGPRLACAVDRELIEALAEKFSAAQVRLASVQPFLVAGFNRIRAHVGNGSCWLVIEEPGRLTLAFIQRGVWVAIRSRRIDERWRDMLPELIERESAFLALSEPCTRVIVCAQAAFDTAQFESWHAKAVSYRELALAWE
ncbi:MAG: hypothetical protein ACREUN_04460 [Burkholderiales bacterium]